MKDLADGITGRKIVHVKYPITYRVPILCYLLSQFAALSAAPLIESVCLAKIFLGLPFFIKKNKHSQHEKPQS